MPAPSRSDPTAAPLRLVVEALDCERGGRRVFSALSFRVEAGGALIVTGPNGAGKSSLLRAIAGLVRPVGGAIRLDGGDPDLTVAQQCHYFGHLDALKPALTVTDNLAFWRTFYRPTGVGCHDALDAVDLGHIAHLPAAYLSAGQRRRLALARLLVSHRPVWLLDEPTSALDRASEERLARLMSEHRARGGLIVAATHQALGLEDALILRMDADGAEAAA